MNAHAHFTKKERKHGLESRKSQQTTAAARHLAQHGWAKYRLADEAFAPWQLKEFEAFADRACREVPDDTYDASGLRKRRYGLFVFIPSVDVLAVVSRTFNCSHVAKTSYFQPGSYQPEEGDYARQFDGLLEEQLCSPVVKELIAADFRLGRNAEVIPEAQVYFVGFHIIQLMPRDHMLASVSPNVIHRDGEPITFCHLFGRHNVKGGHNLVTTPECANKTPSEIQPEQILADFELFDPGESYVVDDQRVAHYVNGVGLDDPLGFGHRTVGLVDFCPARRARSDDIANMTMAELIDLKN